MRPRCPARLADGGHADAPQVLRLRDDGTAPPDNPFVGRSGAKPEIFTAGHRHVQGLARHPDGRAFATEHGPLGGDELNLIHAGSNHGWSNVSWGRDYTGATPIGTGQRSGEGFVGPRLVWVPSVIGASGLTVYTGDRFPAWRGSILAGGLAGDAGRAPHRARRQRRGDAARVDQTRLPAGAAAVR